MKKRMLIPALLALLIPAASFGAAYYFADRETYPCYNMCERIALTGNGSAYIAYNENGRPEILKLDSGGNVTDIYSGYVPSWEYNTKTAYISGMLTCGEAVFAVETRADGRTGRTAAQTIYSLSKDMKPSPFYTYMGDGARIVSMTGSGDDLFVTLISEDGKTAFVDTFDIAGGASGPSDEGSAFDSPFNDGFYEAHYINGSLYASTMSGEVLRCSVSRSVNVLDNPARDHRSSGIIEAFGADQNGVFFYDAMDGLAYGTDAQGRLERRDNPAVKPGEHAYAMARAGPYDLALITEEHFDVMRIAFEGEITAELTQPRLSPLLVIKKSAPRALYYILASACAILLIYVFSKVFKKRQKLLTKFLLVTTPLTLLAFAVFGAVQHIGLRDLLLKEKDSLSLHYNQLIASSISYGEMDFITRPQAYKSAEYRRLQDKLRVDYSGEAARAAVKNDVLILADGSPHIGVSLDYPCLFHAGDLFAEDVMALLEDCGSLGRTVTGTTLDQGGEWSATASPIKSGDGRLAGYVLTRISKSDIAALLNDNLMAFARFALTVTLPLLLFLTLVFRRTLRPVGKLRNAMQEVLSGNYEVRLNSVTKDEFLGINLAFNKMCADLKTQMYKLERISDSYYRFVPRNILPVLGKKSILDVNYGDSRRFSACCCALCAHNLSELQAAGTDEAFLEYMGLIGGCINASLKRCGGVLMSPEMDLRGLLVIFLPFADDSGADRSAAACETFSEDIRQFFSAEGSRFAGISPKTTLLLHRADMLYGITGVNDAAFPFLLSDGVDFIMRAAPLFENATTQTVMTQDILPGLADASVMEIGWRETAKGGECRLYIPRGPDPTAAESFSKGLECFYNKDFYSARALFSAVWRREPSNGIARWYALAADKYLLYPQQFASSQLFGTDVYQADF